MCIWWIKGFEEKSRKMIAWSFFIFVSKIGTVVLTHHALQNRLGITAHPINRFSFGGDPNSAGQLIAEWRE